MTDPMTDPTTDPTTDRGTIYVVDDDPAMRDSLEFLLGTAGFRVASFASAAAFLAALPDLEFGCVVSDLRMPGIDGMELLRRLATQPSPPPTVIMTGHGDVPLAVEAMKLGATDFLEKPFEDEHLIRAIESSLRRHASTAEGTAERDDIACRIAALTPREHQVLDGIVAGQSNKLIARDLDISPRTVEIYRANVMTKMQAGSVSELVRLVLRGGALKD